jgi:hypothetical protein
MESKNHVTSARTVAFRLSETRRGPEASSDAPLRISTRRPSERAEIAGDFIKPREHRHQLGAHQIGQFAFARPIFPHITSYGCREIAWSFLPDPSRTRVRGPHADRSCQQHTWRERPPIGHRPRLFFISKKSPRSRWRGLDLRGRNFSDLRGGPLPGDNQSPGCRQCTARAWLTSAIRADLRPPAA